MPPKPPKSYNRSTLPFLFYGYYTFLICRKQNLSLVVPTGRDTFCQGVLLKICFWANSGPILNVMYIHSIISEKYRQPLNINSARTGRFHSNKNVTSRSSTQQSVRAGTEPYRIWENQPPFPTIRPRRDGTYPHCLHYLHSHNNPSAQGRNMDALSAKINDHQQSVRAGTELQSCLSEAIPAPTIRPRRDGTYP